MAPFDVVLKGGHVLDPASGTDRVADVGIRLGKIEDVGDGLDLSGARVVEAAGRYVMPGHIDTHAHVSAVSDRGVDRALGFKMLAESGTTTALDLNGEPHAFADGMKRRGSGMNFATLLSLVPFESIPEDDPRPRVVRETLDQALADGSIGVKMIGGYHPFTPEATSGIIEVANARGAWIAYHIGSKETGSQIEGLREVPSILGKGRLHVAHVNSYTRGVIDKAEDEVREAFEILSRMKGQIVSEAYLAQINGTNGFCDEEGNVVANVPRNCLQLRGYPLNETGMRQALLDGYGFAHVEREGRIELVTGEEAVAIWEAAGTNASLSFPVNPASSAYTLTTEKDENGEFYVDAVSTDGGSLPRNVAIERTFALVAFGALTALEAAHKLSWMPSRMLGLLNKGHFSQGADADITVVDPGSGRATMSLVAGETIMQDGRSVATGGTWLVTSEGEAAAQASGLKHEVIDLAQSRLYEGWR
ncbi:MAG: amidohydrolase family protein [Chloroflexi bacterium]|nr:amidohydrolase family protein [Chloroflexota bacterium]